MENGLNFDTYIASLPIEKKYIDLVKDFYHNYKHAAESNGVPAEEITVNFHNLVNYIVDAITHPFYFEPFHKALFTPINFYQFGLDFMKALVDGPALVKGKDELAAMDQALKRGENVILFGNHQTEPDPQMISIALEAEYPEMAKSMIFVAGERVTTDPLAVPFSKGRYLLCIYSKRYIDFPPELKLQKQLHNKKTMEQMSELLKTGGKIIYVAPSGGRDRKDDAGHIQVAKFDPQSLEMFILMAKKAKTPTHFHTLALSTYNVMPPPEGIQKELGEKRLCNKTKIGLHFGPRIDLNKYSHIADKHEQRELRAQELTEEVSSNYRNLF